MHQGDAARISGPRGHRSTTVVGVESLDQGQASAWAGRNVAITLSDIDPMTVDPGDVITR